MTNSFKKVVAYIGSVIVCLWLALNIFIGFAYPSLVALDGIKLFFTNPQELIRQMVDLFGILGLTVIVLIFPGVLIWSYEKFSVFLLRKRLSKCK